MLIEISKFMRGNTEGRRMVLQWVAIAALALSLSACGKSGAPEPPDPKNDHFPRQYPDPSSL